MSATPGPSNRQQRFTQRNVFYLRCSPYVVLQTILYLDHRHVDWLNQNPSVFSRVLSILRTRIMPKLRKEADSSGKLSGMSKKERVDVYTDRDFQVAYFFRRMDDRHSVLLKEKSLIFPKDPTLPEVKVEDEDGGNLHAPIPRRTPGLARRQQPSEPPGGGDGFSQNQPFRIKDSPDHDHPITIDDEDDDADTDNNANDTHGTGLDSAASGDSLDYQHNDDEDEEGTGPSSLFLGREPTVDADAFDGMPPPSMPSTRLRRTRSAAQHTTRSAKRVRIDTQVKSEHDSNQDGSVSALVHHDLDQLESQDQDQDQQQQSLDRVDDTEHEQETALDEIQDNAAIEITQDDEEKMKPKLQVKYAGFRIFGKLLVLVIEPSKRVLAANPELFGAKERGEVRQLSVAPVASVGGGGSSRSQSRSGSVQMRFTSLEPGGASGRNAGAARGHTPLFRGITPQSDGEYRGGYPSLSPSPALASTPAPPTSMRNPTPSAYTAPGSADGAMQSEESIDEEPTVAQLEGIELATQMLEREEQTAGGNDIEDGD